MSSPRAFPNAYIDTDAQNTNWTRFKVLAGSSLAGLAYFGLTILLLHIEPTGYNPVTQAVSDYAVGPFGTYMALGFFGGGVGLASLALANMTSGVRSRVFRVGSGLLLVAGVSLFLVGLFPTDIEGSVSTLHGTVHSILSELVFSFGPIGMLLVSYSYGRRWFAASLVIYAATGAFLSANLALSIGQAGLAERIFILFLLSWWITSALQTSRGNLPITRAS